jgi:hypothetical protein
MKNKVLFFIALAMPLLTLSAHEERINNPFGWINGEEVDISNGHLIIHSYKGLIELNAIEYDAKNDRYLVECFSSNGEHYYPVPEKPTH